MEPLPRPAVPQTVAERARAWIVWFGVARLLASAVAVLVVAAGAYWLVRTPPPPTEALLPMATTSGPDASTAPAATIAPPTVPAVVVVHVAGAVLQPGVHELAGTPRVADAVAAAGGPTADADRDAINLAAPVPDGSRVYVPAVGETAPPELITTPPGAGSSATSGPVDVNRAGVDELDALPGVGPATANAIVTERKRNGPFPTVDDLLRVPGIGPAKLDALRDLVAT